MYKKKEKIEQTSSNNKIESILAEGVRFEGDMFCEGSMKVEGVIERGKIKVANTLAIGPTGRINGEISGDTIVVFGEANGKINAKTLMIKSTGKVLGEVYTEDLVTESGGVISGTCEMKTAESSRQQAEKPPKTAATEDDQGKPIKIKSS